MIAYWNNSPQEVTWLDCDPLSWLQANMSLLLLLNAASLTKTQQTVFGLIQPVE